MENRINEIVICDCNSIEHQFIFTYHPNDLSWEEVYLQIHLNKKSFWNRLVYGVKYIFGRKCNFGAFDEVVIPCEDAEKFQRIADYLRSIQTRQKK